MLLKWETHWMPSSVEEIELAPKVAESDASAESAPEAKRPIDMAPVPFRDPGSLNLVPWLDASDAVRVDQAPRLAHAVPWRDGPPRNSEPTLPEGFLVDSPESQSELPTRIGPPPMGYRDGCCALCGQRLTDRPEENPFARKSLGFDTLAYVYTVGGLGLAVLGACVSSSVLAGTGIGMAVAILGMFLSMRILFP